MDNSTSTTVQFIAIFTFNMPLKAMTPLHLDITYLQIHYRKIIQMKIFAKMMSCGEEDKSKIIIIDTIENAEFLIKNITIIKCLIFSSVF